VKQLINNSILSLIAGLLVTPTVWSQNEPVELADTIIVSAQRTPTTYTELSRTVTVIGPDQIASAPTRSIIDLLSYALGVEVRRMGNNGVRADIAIRGGTFEQTLVLVDGVKVTDPQTGHHNLDLPFDLADVERIEIVRGSGSKLYGPNAMSGVINIITKRPVGTSVRVESVNGDHNLSENRLSATATTGPVGHRITAARRTCSGYINNTEFDQTNFGYSSTIETGPGPVNLSVAYAEREFGAYKLYSDKYADEWEATSTLFATATGRLLVGKSLLSPKLYWRQHKDDFVLFRDNPELSRNKHTSKSFGLELQATIPTPLGETVVGGELGADDITSGKLGDHYRSRIGIFAEQRISVTERFSIVPGLSINRHNEHGWNAWPGIDLGYTLSDRARIYLTLNRSYRVPTYTELFYEDPGNRGDPLLQPEDVTSLELGNRFTGEQISFGGSVFAQRGTDQIDWARLPGGSVWQIQNLARVTTSGVELQFGLNSILKRTGLEIQHVGLQYAYLDSDRSSNDFEYKYLLEHLRHQLTFTLDLNWFDRVSQYSTVRYARRMTGGEHTVVDSKLSFAHQYGSIFAEVSNMFNEAYSEIRSIPMPGRWLRVGLTFDLTTE
jgi:iron complex outermembrane receptor protein